MQSRITTCLGLNVLEEGSQELLGKLSGILIHPDDGKVEGFFVQTHGFTKHDLFVSSLDIVSFGTRIVIRDRDCLGDPDEVYRLQELIEDPRPVLGNKIVTKSGRLIGTCRDVQFDTKTMMLQWVFPKRLWRWRPAVPAHQIIEVKTDQITIKDREIKVPAKEDEADVADVIETLTEVADPKVSRKTLPR